MADFRFTCSHCGQEIECDELWCGHEIQCPTCKTELTVPPKPEAPPHAALTSGRPGQPKLSIGQSRHQRSAAPPPPPPQEVLIQRQLAQAKAGQQGSGMKWVAISVVVVVLGVAGYFGYGYFTEWQAKRAEAAQQASAPAPVTNAVPVEPPGPPKELPLLPAVWTLDVAAAKIPEGKANGAIAGTNFVVEAARLDKVGTAYLLQLLQGPTASPDLGFRIYLHPNAGEGVTNRTWTVSQDMKGPTVPQIVTLRKTGPKFAPQTRNIFSGYAMKLELGQLTNGVVPGKIFLAVPPDTEQSVVAGVFKANTSIGDPTVVTAARPVAKPAAAPRPSPAATAPPPAYRPRGRR